MPKKPHKPSQSSAQTDARRAMDAMQENWDACPKDPQDLAWVLAGQDRKSVV